jgi:hypothetical protein
VNIAPEKNSPSSLAAKIPYSICFHYHVTDMQALEKHQPLNLALYAAPSKKPQLRKTTVDNPY